MRVRARFVALLGLVTATSCGHPRVVSTATAFRAGAVDATGQPPKYVAVHVDHLQAGSLTAFAKARASWLDVLARSATSDGRGLFLQTGDSGFLSLRPFESLSDLERQGKAVKAALAGVDPTALAAYDAASDALLAPPHRSEIWRFDESLSYGATDPTTPLASAGWGKMTVEEIDPTPAGEAYEKAWKEIRAALTAQSYPLVRVTYWSQYGSGNLVSFWLAKSQRQSLETPLVEAAVTEALGAELSEALFARQKKAVLGSESIDILPRPDLSSKTL